MDFITAQDLLEIYNQGCFPMAENASDADFDIFKPVTRSILPFDNLHVSKSLKKRVLRHEFEIRANTAFAEVITACGNVRDKTWINQRIKDLFIELHHMGHAHSIESWKDGELVGGLYGLQIGSAFCGESMFSTATDASKVALVHLCARMKATGFTLLDAQLENPHLEQFGQKLISQAQYLEKLEKAKNTHPDFLSVDCNEQVLVSKYLNKTISGPLEGPAL